MKRINIVGLCVMAVFAMGAVLAASALAEEFPGLGRCVEVAKGTGKYTSSNCLNKDTDADENFEWEGGPGANSAFTSTGGLVELEAIDKEKIDCNKEIDSGTYIGESEAESVTVFQGCASISTATPCQSVGKSSEIETEVLRSTYGIIKAPATVGTLVEPKPPGTELIKFECGGSGSGKGPAVIVRGSLIAATTKVDKMETTAVQKFSEAKGIQKPQSFEGEATKHHEETEVVGGPPPIQSAQLATITITNSAPLELRAHAPTSSP
jgi:hypothetical protein